MNTLQTIHPEFLTLSAEQYRAIGPYLWVFGGIVLAIVASVLHFVKPKWPVFLLTIATVVAGIYGSVGLLQDPTIPLFNSMMVSDAYSNFFDVLFLASAGFTAFASLKYLDSEKLQHPEYYILMLFSALGMMLMAAATDLIVIFIALELMSLTVYVLVGFRRSDRKSNEAAMKYFVLGSAASAVLLYGTALIYGSTGSTGMTTIVHLIQGNAGVMTPVFTLGVWLVFLGFLFKVASVPFHMWMPDVYEGAPTPVTGFMTTGLKAAAFATFVRVFVSLGYGHGLSEVIQSHIHDIVWVVAALTMVIGNIVALQQTNLKRMLAFSSIAHSGYLLVGMLAGSTSEQGYAPVVMYLAAYAIMNMGAFIVLTVISAKNDSGLNLHDISGLSRKHPWLAFCLALFMFSMAGIPPTAGFAAKYLIFYSAIQAHETPLVVISVLCSAISVYYYLRVLVYMYMRDPMETSVVSRMSAWSAVALAAMVVMTLQIGVLPARMMSAAKRAVTSL